MQKNKYNIVVANPANNITVFVLDYVEKEEVVEDIDISFE